jgi:RHS repeat-associated protein
MHYFGARYYTADFPRFISPDPVSGRLMTPITWNRYLYCRNDPINYIDPDGKIAKLALARVSDL